MHIHRVWSLVFCWTCVLFPLRGSAQPIPPPAETLSPSQVDYRAFAAHRLLQQGQYDAARSEVAPLLSLDVSGLALYVYGMASKALGDAAAARLALEKLSHMPAAVFFPSLDAELKSLQPSRPAWLPGSPPRLSSPLDARNRFRNRRESVGLLSLGGGGEGWFVDVGTSESNLPTTQFFVQGRMSRLWPVEFGETDAAIRLQLSASSQPRARQSPRFDAIDDTGDGSLQLPGVASADVSGELGLGEHLQLSMPAQALWLWEPEVQPVWQKVGMRAGVELGAQYPLQASYFVQVIRVNSELESDWQSYFCLVCESGIRLISTMGTTALPIASQHSLQVELFAERLIPLDGLRSGERRTVGQEEVGITSLLHFRASPQVGIRVAARASYTHKTLPDELDASAASDDAASDDATSDDAAADDAATDDGAPAETDTPVTDVYTLDMVQLRPRLEATWQRRRGFGVRFVYAPSLQYYYNMGLVGRSIHGWGVLEVMHDF